MGKSRAPQISAQVEVIDDLPVPKGTGARVRVIAAKGREGDARPIGGFYLRRRYEGEEFVIPSWEMFSSNWMEFVGEPPADWIEKIEAREQKKLEFAQAEAAKPKTTGAENLMFAMSEMMARAVGRTPGEFDYATGKFKEPPPAGGTI